VPKAETGADRPPLWLPEAAQPTAYSAALTAPLLIIVPTREDKTMTDAPPEPDTTYDFAAWEAQERERARLAAEVRPANKAAVFDTLARAGITLVTVGFDGSGDEGQIESIDAFAGDGLDPTVMSPAAISENAPGNMAFGASTISLEQHF
jgi:hypothetical protein